MQVKPSALLRSPQNFKALITQTNCVQFFSSSQLRHILLKPRQDALFEPRNIALADAHHIRNLLLRLFRTTAQPEAQTHDFLFPHGQL